jgi:hypothetical protein
MRLLWVFLVVFLGALAMHSEARIASRVITLRSALQASALAKVEAAIEALQVEGGGTRSFQDGFLRCPFFAPGDIETGEPVHQGRACITCSSLVSQIRTNLNPKFAVPKEGIPFRYIYAAIDGTMSDVCEDNPGAVREEISGCCRLADSIVNQAKGVIAKGLKLNKEPGTICFNAGFCTVDSEEVHKKKEQEKKEALEREEKERQKKQVQQEADIPEPNGAREVKAPRE